MVVAMAAATAVVIMEVAMVAATAVVIMEVAMVVAMAAATAVVILNLMLLIAINPLGQKVGKTEVMETLLKILNLKVEEVEEKEVFPARGIL